MITVSIGKHARDTFWQTKSFEGPQALYESLFAQFRYGPKDGACLVSGALAGGDRGSNLLTANYLIMLDHDNGITLDEVEEKIKAVGLRAILWTTHSHLKTTTDLGQGGIVAHRKKKRFGDDVAQLEVVRDYLRERKQWTEPMLASIESAEDFMDPKKGMQIRVTHAPMPKVRSLFFLEKPFTFTEPGQVQKDRVAEWKDRLKGFAFKLDLPFDSACQDPAHLMYLPACASAEVEETHHHEIRTLDGADCTLMFDFVRYSETADAAAIRGEAERLDLPRTFRTAGLGTFIRRGGPAETFRAADWFRDLSGQEPRRVADGVKFHFECPNDAEHSNAGDPKDTAFFAQNGSVETGAKWMLHCRHDSCQSKFASDRARLLDFACEQFGINDAHDLLHYTDSETLTEGDGGADDTDYDAVGDVDGLIAEVTEKTGPEVIDQIVKYLAKFPAPSLIVQDRRIKTLGQKTKLGTRTITNAVKAAQNVLPAAAQPNEAIPGAIGGPGDEVFREAPPPPDDPADTRTIWKEWGFEDKMRVLKGAMLAANEDKQIVFVQSDGKAVRAVATASGVIFVPIESPSQWAILCLDLGLRFMSTDSEGAVAPFKDIMTLLIGEASWDFPVVERAVEVPVFGEDGSLRTDAGYHAGAKVYLDPRIDFTFVPERVTDEDIETALDIIGYTLADFPFSDVFTGADPLPPRVHGEGKTPNFARGVSSRANAHAMLLQPFARSLIGNEPTPMYFIDKSEKGTGANYLANVLGYMLYGTPMPPQVVSEREEEFEKAITASLYEGRPTIFLDNLNHELSSAALASALTSGIWTGRILGKSHVPRIPVRALWLLAANNGQISEELMRRVVPIRLDAALPNPASDRPPSYYIIPNLMEHLRNTRRDLVWAAHVLVQNYITVAAEDPERLAELTVDLPILQSFQRWSEVMGGILACAGIPGFLGNLGGYKRDNVRDDKSGFAEYVADLFERHGEKWLGLDEALDILQEAAPNMPGDKPNSKYGLVIRVNPGADDGEKKQKLGTALSRNKGNVFDTRLGNLQIERDKPKGRPVQYRIIQSKTYTDDNTDTASNTPEDPDAAATEVST
jgi:hypothetical protein